MQDTIYALATAPGKAGVAIIRISGEASRGVLTALGGAVPPHRSSRVCVLRGPGGAILDHALVLFFEEGGSFTGEEVVELHLHGSVAGIRVTLSAIEATGLARLAAPGEFTRRALMNDRLDLTRVQGLADVIDAETEAQHRQAMRVFDGEMTRTVEGWRRDLVRAIALIEATIDFADEDVPEDVLPEVRALVDGVLTSLEAQLVGVAGAEQIRAGFDVAIVGAPNSGKSSLLNALTRSEAAIVSDIAGTTRDVIEVRLNINGLQVNLLDTAGLRETEDTIERIGVDRARRRADAADLRVFLHEGPQPADLNVRVRDGDIVLRSKVDLAPGSEGISVVTGMGLDDLLRRIGAACARSTGEAGLISRDRDRRAVEAAADGLRRLLPDLDEGATELVSADLRAVATRLQSLIGGVDVEAILDEVFSSFCLGK